MHFTVLSAMPLPQDITAAKDSVPVEDVTNFIMRKLYLANLSSQKPMPAPELSPADIDKERWECLMEIMVSNLLAPYNQNTTNIAYMAFEDQTDEGRATYEQSGIDCVKTPDGRIIPCVDYEFSRRYELHDGKVYRQDFGQLHHRKQTKKAKKYISGQLGAVPDGERTDYPALSKGGKPVEELIKRSISKHEYKKITFSALLNLSGTHAVPVCLFSGRG